MLVREYREGDLDALRAIHAAQGFDYALPDLSNPLFITKLVLLDARAVEGSSSFVVAQLAAPKRQEHNSATVPAVRDARPTGTVSKSSNHILGAALLRLTAEAYLLLDPSVGTPRERWQWLLALHEGARREAWQRGLEDVHAWLPPPIAQKFGRRLKRLGWRRDDAWTPYCTRLNVE